MFHLSRWWTFRLCPVWVILNTAVRGIWVHDFLGMLVFILGNWWPRSGNCYCMTNMFISIWKIVLCSHHNVWKFRLLNILINTSCIFLKLQTFWWHCILLVLICICLVTKDIEHLQYVYLSFKKNYWIKCPLYS